MAINDEITDELNQVMKSALFQLKKIVDSDTTKRHDFLSILNTFLLGIISTAVDLVETNLPGSAPDLATF